MPVMNASYTQIEGKPAVNQPAHVNFGLAIDLAKPDGSRQLLVPSIKKAETMDFAQFWAAYEDLVRRARGGKLGVDDFAGTTISLTNPGGIGTVHSVPRLMQGQGTIIGVGAMDYPAEFAGASTERLARLGISKVLTITSTYDHRIIQGRSPASSCASCRRSSSARTASTTACSPRCASPTSRCAGSATTRRTPRSRRPSPRRSPSWSTPTARAGTSWRTPTRSRTASASTATWTSRTTA